MRVRLKIAPETAPRTPFAPSGNTTAHPRDAPSRWDQQRQLPPPPEPPMEPKCVWQWVCEKTIEFLFNSHLKERTIQHPLGSVSVLETPATGVTPIQVHGLWSPWSTMDSPCINEKDGRKVECGGGVRTRYRSCTNPEPRYGGHICHGSALEKHDCNMHSCARKIEGGKYCLGSCT